MFAFSAPRCSDISAVFNMFAIINDNDIYYYMYYYCYCIYILYISVSVSTNKSSALCAVKSLVSNMRP